MNKIFKQNNVFFQGFFYSLISGIEVILCFLVFIQQPSFSFWGIAAIPIWFVEGFFVILGVGILYVLLKDKEGVRSFFYAIFFVLVLSIHLIFVQKASEVQQLILIVLWAFCIVEIVYYFLSQWFVKNHIDVNRWWRIVSSVVLGVTVLWVTIVRFWHLETTPTIFLIILCLLWVVVLRWMPAIIDQPQKYVKSSHSFYWLIGIGILIIWGAWIRYAALDTFTFQNDEYFHVNTAMGYLKTGTYVQWNYVTEEAGNVYERAWPYTWQVAKSIQLFGASEWSMRFPALLWGILFLLLFPILIRRWTSSWEATFYATALVTFDPSLIWSSTYTRMYSLFWTMILIIIWIFWLSIRRKKTAMWKRILWLCVALIGIKLSTAIHMVGVLLIGGVVVTLFILAIKKWHKKWFAIVMGVFLLCIGLVMLQWIRPFLPFALSDVLILRQFPAWDYLAYPTRPLILPFFGILLFLCGIFLFRSIQNTPTWIIIAGSTVVPILIYFTFFSHRYAARKYSFFVFFLIFTVIAFLWEQLMKRMIIAPRWRFVVGSIAFLWICIPFSVPGIEENGILQRARSDESYVTMQYHDYPAAYEIVEKLAAFGDSVVTLSPKTYYFHRPDLHIIQIPPQKRMTLEEFQRIISDHPRGWIIIPRYQWPHIQKKVREHIQQSYSVVDNGKTTNILIYSWGIDIQ